MSEVKLVAVSDAYAEAIWDYRQEFLDHQENIEGAFGLAQAVQVGEWLQFIENGKSEKTMVEGWVPATSYMLVREFDERILGIIQIRHRLNDNLRHIGGHIGYSVRKSERKNGYATKMVALALRICRDLQIDKVLITCHVENEGSRKTILNNGGVLEKSLPELEKPDRIILHYWIEL